VQQQKQEQVLRLRLAQKTRQTPLRMTSKNKNKCNNKSKSNNKSKCNNKSKSNNKSNNKSKCNNKSRSFDCVWRKKRAKLRSG
jgi:hypothetical protein